MFVPSLANALVGGWKVQGTVTEEAQSIFKKAAGTLLGVDYTPLVFATQPVKGTNYCFICKYSVVSYGENEGYVSIIIYAPLDGDPKVTSIKRII